MLSEELETDTVFRTIESPPEDLRMAITFTCGELDGLSYKEM